MDLSRSQLGCKSTSQIVPDHTAFDRQAKRYSCSVARFFETASKRARAHSCVFVVKDGSGSAAIDYLLQSCAYGTIHRHQTMAGTLPLRVHQKKPIRSHSYVSSIGWSKHRQAAEVYIFDFSATPYVFGCQFRETSIGTRKYAKSSISTSISFTCSLGVR